MNNYQNIKKISYSWKLIILKSANYQQINNIILLPSCPIAYTTMQRMCLHGILGRYQAIVRLKIIKRPSPIQERVAILRLIWQTEHLLR